ncbi:amidohydrolase family protein [uncultured Paraglaciecola sp.]|uniref:amidohydrolase family protein n=1 Tax=uncultured Paraglaciecola sp. TaxID=1765024 RepID=UPI0030DA86D1
MTHSRLNNKLQPSVALMLSIVLVACSETHTSEPQQSSPAALEEHYTMEDFPRVEKIDAHVHANNNDLSFLEQAKLDNFTLLSINVDYPDFPNIAEQRKIALQLKKLDEEHFKFASTFSMNNWQHEDWQQKVIEDIDLAIKQGAKAVKTWKNIGMTYKDKTGQLVMIDHPSFDSIFGHMKDKNLPLIGHQGEPQNCWLPLEEMTVNNDRQYFAAHPEFHMYLHPEFPSYEAQMEARDRMLAKNSQLAFMGAHMASLEWSIDKLAQFLVSHPNAVVDIAARSGQIQYQSKHDYQKVRDFFIKYQDRILYATDLTHGPGRDAAEFKQEVQDKWRQDWKYLSTLGVSQVPEVDGDVKGLALPKSVINKIYRLNAQRFFNIKQS